MRDKEGTQKKRGEGGGEHSPISPPLDPRLLVSLLRARLCLGQKTSELYNNGPLVHLQTLSVTNVCPFFLAMLTEQKKG